MKKILLILIVAVFALYSCCEKGEKKDPGILVFSYRILETEEFRFNDKHANRYIKAKVLLNIPDTIVNYVAISKCILSICTSENIVAAKFYRNQSCFDMDNGNLARDEEVYRECYIGQIDVRGQGLNWQYSIKPDDFHFYKSGRLPMQIDIK